MVPAPPSPPAPGLAGLRRRGTLTELLVLYECTTEEPTQLRPIAERLGLTVQAASHVFRLLDARGLAEVRNGRYLPTQAGVAWLHASFGELRDELVARLARLHIVRSTRAVAVGRIRAGASVYMEMADGLLTARSGTDGPSRGRAQSDARPGELLEVGELEGIVPIVPGTITILSVPRDTPLDERAARRLATRVGRSGAGLLAAAGLEAFHLLRRSTERPIVRFGIPAACREASQVGVASLVVALDAELPRLLGQFGATAALPLAVRSLI